MSLIDVKTVVTGVVTACAMLIITGFLNLDSRLTAHEARTEIVLDYAEQINKINETVIRVDTVVSEMKDDIGEIKSKIK